MGAHADLVAELESLVREHPLREQLRALLMRALYGAGRQAEALDVYRDTRQRLVDELGIEPSPALRELETAILRQKPELTPEPQRGEPGKQRAIIVVADDPNRLEQLLAIAEPLARRRELILTRLLRSDAELDAANAELSEARRILGERGVSVRVAAFTTAEPGADAARMAGEHEVDLMLVDGPPELLETGLPSADLGVMLERIPCDVGVLVGSGVLGSGPVVRRSAASSTTGRRSRWPPGSLGRPARRFGSSARRPNPIGAAETQAGSSRAPRSSCSKWSESSPSLCSSRRASRVSSRRRRLRACSWSDSQIGGEPRASATRGEPWRGTQRFRRSSCAAASVQAGSRRKIR
jgi:Bacterial transcriptional activator domain